MHKNVRRAALVVVGAVVVASVGAGGAYAGGKITSQQIKNQTIQSQDIATGGVGTSELRNDGVYRKDLAKYMESKIYTKNNVSGYYVKNVTLGGNGTANEPIPAGESANGSVECEGDDVALGGGVTNDAGAAATGLTVNQSGPVYKALDGGTDGANAWAATVTNTSDSGKAALVWVTCGSLN